MYRKTHKVLSNVRTIGEGSSSTRSIPFQFFWKLAIVYVRQSSPMQVLENRIFVAQQLTESAIRRSSFEHEFLAF